MRIYSVGHSSRELHEFISLLKFYRIELVVDVRSYPISSRFPHFSKGNLRESLEKVGIDYIHMPGLGGIRDVSYREHMSSELFKESLSTLTELSVNRVTTLMCAEKNWRECHRRFIAEELTRRGVEVVHIVDEKRFEEHPRSIFI